MRTPSEIYDRLRRLEGEASEYMMRLAKRMYGKEGLAAAWSDFHGSPNVPVNETHPEFEFFTRWLEYDWLPEDGPGPGEALLESNDSSIDPEILRLVGTTLDSPYSFLQVTALEPGVGFTARDILRKTEHRIIERTGSLTFERGSILYARVVEMDGIEFMMGNGTRVISFAFMADLVTLREKILEKNPSTTNALADDTLIDFEKQMRLFYFNLIDAASNPSRNLQNTDGDPMLFHTIRYGVPSFERAVQALRDLEPEMSNADLMGTNTGDHEGKTAVIHWSKQRKGRGKGDTVVQAVFRIQATALVAEVNSARRAKRARKEIERRLGKDAVYLGTEIHSPEGALKKADQNAGSEGAVKRAEERARLMALPEVQAMLKREMEKHLASWPDTPVPALRGMTPRKAAKDPIGRELLESLLLDFESKNRRAPDAFNRVDTEKLRKELGMTPKAGPR
jgi:glycerol-3-phosphate cytidylyltransferase-like family protein